MTKQEKHDRWKKYYLKNRDHILALARKWKEEHPRQDYAITKRWKQNHQEIVRAKEKERKRRNPHKVQARRIVERAVRSGKLKPQSCQICGQFFIASDGRRAIHAHHDNYDLPFNIRWLCPTHHMMNHKIHV